MPPSLLNTRYYLGHLKQSKEGVVSCVTAITVP